jgi:hypothetical protein
MVSGPEDTKKAMDDFQKTLMDNIVIEEAWGKEDEEVQRAIWGRTHNLGIEFAEIFNSLDDRLADNIIEWEGWGKTLLDTVKSLAKSLLAAFLDGFLSPITGAISQIGTNLTSILSGKGGLSDLFSGILGGKGTTGGGGLLSKIPGVGGVLGGGAAGAAAGSGSAAATTGTSLGVGEFGSTTASAGGTAGAGAGGGSLAGTVGFAGGIGMAGIGIALGLADLAKGPTSYEAAATEVARDFGGVDVGRSAGEGLFGGFKTKIEFESFLQSLGIPEADFWPHRAEILRSPVVLAYIAGKAKEQGKMDEFLASLSPGGKGSWGMPMDSAFADYISTGNGAAINEIYRDLAAGAFAGVSDVVSNWQSKLLLPETSGATQLARGMDYVPYDNFPALLHKGEAVIPANENASRGANIQISIGAVYGINDLKSAFMEIFQDLSARGVLA